MSPVTSTCYNPLHLPHTFFTNLINLKPTKRSKVHLRPMGMVHFAHSLTLTDPPLRGLGYIGGPPPLYPKGRLHLAGKMKEIGIASSELPNRLRWEPRSTIYRNVNAQNIYSFFLIIHFITEVWIYFIIIIILSNNEAF